MQEVPLHSVCTAVFAGFPPEAKSAKYFGGDGNDGSARGVGLRALSSAGTVDLSKLERVTLPARGAAPERALRVGDVLLASRGSLPKAALVGSDIPNSTYASANLFVVRTNPNAVLPNYLFAWLESVTQEPQHFLLRRSTTGQLTLRLSDLNELLFPLRPLDEQERLAETADALRHLRHIQYQLAAQANSLFSAHLRSFFAKR